MRPYFETKLDRIAMKPVLICGEDGMPREFDFHLLAGQKVGFLMRSMIPSPQAPLHEAPPASPLARLAKRMYLPEGRSIAGESDSLLRLGLPKYSEQFPTLVIETAKP